jgi:predicted TIM-barrel fold metal-dependent hydrolase
MTRCTPSAVRSVSPSAAVRKALDHPVIDGDGHTIEFMPAFVERLGDEKGGKYVDWFQGWFEPEEFRPTSNQWYRLSPKERRDRRLPRPAFWGQSSKHTDDRATAMLPSLLYARMEELGFDYSISYPTIGISLQHTPEDEYRHAVVRTLNRHNAALFAPFSDRLTHAAIVPMHTPEEAIAELRYVTGTLGMKTIMMPSFIERPVAAYVSDGKSHQQPYWFDTYGIDSEYEYDLVWKTCMELNLAPAFHSAMYGLGLHRSVSSYVYNHIQMFAPAHAALAKSLVLGGVTTRFPKLNFAFLEGGVAWAIDLLGLMAGHFDKRNRRDIENYNVEHVDIPALTRLFQEHSPDWAKHLNHERAMAMMGLVGTHTEDPATIDEFAATDAERPRDFARLTERFFYGLEAEDPTLPSASRGPAPFNARFKAVMGSDIGHWDVAVMNEVLAEAYEAVEHGSVSNSEFKNFVFGNAVRLHGQMNPKFFDGTAIEREAKLLLSTNE